MPLFAALYPLIEPYAFPCGRSGSLGCTKVLCKPSPPSNNEYAHEHSCRVCTLRYKLPLR